MGRKEEYIQVLRTISDWIPYLKANSNLPGPRGNLELAYAAAQLSSMEQMKIMLAADGPDVLENSPEVFVVFCGIVSSGTLFTKDNPEILGIIKHYADDPRWRIREAAAMALQEIGKKDIQLLLTEVDSWLDGSYCLLRAVAAGLCEPELFTNIQIATDILNILDRITIRFQDGPKKDKNGYEVLKKGLCYCWSVAAVANPDYGKILIEKWIMSGNAPVREVIQENLKKNRMVTMDEGWVNKCQIDLAKL